MDSDERARETRADELEVAWRLGAQAWPELPLPYDAFSRWLEPRLGELTPPALVAADLYLACAVLCAVPGASDVFVHRFEGELLRHAGRVVDEGLARELVQELMVDLLTASPEHGPRLQQYSGRGPLRVWLRMAITRRALNTKRRPDPPTPLDGALAGVLDEDPELALMRRTYRAEMASIFAEAIAAIPQAERTLLRLHYGEGSTLNELAALHQTSRSALHRRLQAARAGLFERIAQLVGQRLNLSESERQSIMRLFASDLRDSLGRLLR